ncbi:MAG TPA: GIY-YIG nuclease family protein [Candidatus Dojkabacteria bacterium]|nr:GIY-YIG nuclease family protein [Candidatus Dojkabacteria bacterium]
MAREKVCGIYCIENIITNKKYIGLSRDINKRLWSHKTNLIKNKHSNMHLQSAFNLYGIDNFIFYIIEECDKEDLNDKEIYYIELYKARNREFGYNILVGGGGTEGREVTQETREKLSKAGKGRKRNAEFCAHISEVKSGVPRNIDKEWRDKIAYSNAGEKISTRKTSSKYRGVSWNTKDQRWLCFFRHKRLGYFIEEEDAAKYFDSVCWKQLHNKNKLNFPDIDYDTFVPVSPLPNRFYKRKNSSSKYLGVCFLNSNKKWNSNIPYDGEQICLGQFKYEIEAALAYNNAAMELYGYKAVLNDISQEELDELWTLE